MFARRSFFVLALGLLLAPIVAAEDAPKRILFCTHSTGFIHGSVGIAEDTFKELGKKAGYQVTCWRFTGDPDAKVKYKPKKDGPEMEMTALEKYSQDYRARTNKTVEKEHCGRINAESLKKFDAVFFFTTGNPLNAEELKVFTEWLRNGGVLLGTHCATDTLYKTNYGDLIGGYFKGHPSGIQKIKVKLEDPKHPAAAGFTDGMAYDDEIYVFHDTPYDRKKLHIILSVDKDTFKPGDRLTRTDGDYAISWCKMEGKGRVFYTSFGHQDKVWKDEKFQSHLMGGIKWALGQAPGDATPTADVKK